jgi:hypothetical protein
MHTKFLSGKLKWRDYSEDLGCEENIRMYLRKIVWEVVYWVPLTQDRDQWRAVVITVMNLRIS